MGKGVLAALLLLSLDAHAQNDVLWTYSPGAAIAAGPLVLDVNSDGKPEIVVATEDGTFFVLSPGGSEIASHETGGRISSGMLAADVNNDGKTDIVYGTWNGSLVARNVSLDILWSFQAGGRITAAPVYLKQAGEILFGSWDGTFYAVDAAGNLSWMRRTAGPVECGAAVADADRNGRPGVVYGSDDNTIYYVNSFAGRTYSYALEGDVSALIARDINLDGRFEIVAATRDGKVYAFSIPVNGSARSLLFRWQYNASGAIKSSLAAADLDGDGRNEVLFGSEGPPGSRQSGALYILNASGKVVKRYTTTGAVLAPPLVADYDGDGKKEILFGTEAGSVYILNYSGGAEWAYNTGRPVNHAPAAYDFNRDGKAEALLCAGETLYLIGSVLDNDSDGLRDYDEYLLGTDRNKNDSDGDGLADGIDPQPLKKSAAANVSLQQNKTDANVSQRHDEPTVNVPVAHAPEEVDEPSVGVDEPVIEEPAAAAEDNEDEHPAPPPGPDYLPVILFVFVLGLLLAVPGFMNKKKASKPSVRARRSLQKFNRV